MFFQRWRVWKRIESWRVRKNKFVGRNLLEQKSRAFFLKREIGTQFFHCIANSHRRCNTIDRLMVDGELSTDQGIIEGCISHFYR